MSIQYDVKDPGLADAGRDATGWADRQPVLSLIRERFEREHPLKSVRLAACLHVTTETAGRMRIPKAGGEVFGETFKTGTFFPFPTPALFHF